MHLFGQAVHHRLGDGEFFQFLVRHLELLARPLHQHFQLGPPRGDPPSA
ncbi:hypothetical protein [Streptomyces regalis]|nr:hypothetical protein [Streptomyces regalis]